MYHVHLCDRKLFAIITNIINFVSLQKPFMEVFRGDWANENGGSVTSCLPISRKILIFCARFLVYFFMNTCIYHKQVFILKFCGALLDIWERWTSGEVQVYVYDHGIILW